MSGNPALGAFISLPLPSIVEGAALAGLDFVIIDTEHASHNVETVENLIRAAEAYSMTAIVRVYDNDHKLIGRMLDIGAHGIQVPMIDDAGMAKRAVSSCKFAPDGTRGCSAGRGSKWGSYENYYVDANKERLTVCMCETKESVNNIGHIVKTDMLDVLFVGTGDLSQSMGHTGNIHHPDVEAAVRRVRDACVAANVVPGILAYSLEDAKKWISEGFLYVPVFNDMGLYVSAAKKQVEAVRQGISS